MKSKGTAYLLLIFLGALGAHKFYLGKTGVGILYLLTLGLGGIGLIYDLFTLGSQVDVYNALRNGGQRQSQGQSQNITVNMVAPEQPKETDKATIY